MGTENKAIIVGLTDYPYCDCVLWSKAHTVNFADYHNVVALLRPFNNSLSELNWKSLAAIRTQLIRLVRSKGQLVIVIDRHIRRAIVVGGGDISESKADYRVAIPAEFTVTTESGNTIKTVHESHYDDYLAKLKKWTFHIIADDPSKGHYRYRVSREGLVLACCINAYGHMFDVIPQIPELSDAETATEILKAINFPIGPTPPPLWANEIDLPGLSKAQQYIAEQETVINDANDRLVDLKLARSEMQVPIGLLYATGPDFEKVVTNILVKLGATVSDNSYGREDIVLIINEREYIFELTGSRNSIPLRKLRQLSGHVFDAMEQTDKPLKGIMVANPLRDIAPNQRADQDVPEFPDNVIQAAEKYQMAVVSSRWLFDRYCEVLDSKIDGASVLQQIISTDGLVTTGG